MHFKSFFFLLLYQLYIFLVNFHGVIVTSFLVFFTLHELKNFPFSLLFFPLHSHLGEL